jgi:acyl CoA:acetate/3-ketoacid CoA transferase
VLVRIRPAHVRCFPGSDAVLKKVIPVEDAISVLHDGDVLCASGYGGHGIPEQLLLTWKSAFSRRARRAA